MNQEETLALFAKGCDAWNAWAEKLLADRERLRKEGGWQEADFDEEPSWKTKDWLDAAKADFAEQEFPKDADFQQLIFPGEAEFTKATFSGNAPFRKATFSGTAEFEGATFLGDAWFNGATFSGDAGFAEATFSGDAWFNGATFSGHARFDKAIFSGDARFIDETTFSGDTWFNGAEFKGLAWFAGATFSRRAEFIGATFSGNAVFTGAKFREIGVFNAATFSDDAQFGGARFGDEKFTGRAYFKKATFSGDTWFGGAKFGDIAVFELAAFEGSTSFDSAEFKEDASFLAIDVKTVFSLAGTTFRRVPDFIQAHFAEAPRLDDLRIEPRRFWRRTRTRVGKALLAARWRALKRLAIQGHDHARELRFFRGELLARRWSEDKPWHAAFWFGVIYQLLSDFGRSILRPLLWLSASVVFFTDRYLSLHPRFEGKSSPLVDWLFYRLSSSDVEATPLACVAGSVTPWLDALFLSVHKGLLILGGLPGEKLNQIYACLYGIQPSNGGQPSRLPESFTPVIPDGATAWGLLQYPLSAVLIFLALLAIRNHFRIK
ncbi:pentapeptide repeat-containing protein [Pelagibius sp. 7325]|uniref:pentapeptide repeat-containing protein n=1 Tax=Pelagibius sp. 7325 TaxID=3131994 RepID=UPI0030EF85B6